MRRPAAHNVGVEQSTPPFADRRWTVVVPVKATSRGKSRIQLAPAVRRSLARALAADTLTGAVAARRVRAVLVVIEDAADGAALRRDLGRAADRLTLVRTDTRELNAAIGDGLAAAGTGPVAVLPADLPGVTGDELDRALALAEDEFARGATLLVIPDRQGSGTTLLAGTSADRIRQRYGPGSFAAHLAEGARELVVGDESRLRRDVDTVADLLLVPAGRTAAVTAAAGLDVGDDAARCADGQARA